ncbi:MAG TPA: phospholipase A, partial [Polyangiaceae bacterium]|nr:phospholipase A [Polyangiaceae bacterium]
MAAPVSASAQPAPLAPTTPAGAPKPDPVAPAPPLDPSTPGPAPDDPSGNVAAPTPVAAPAAPPAGPAAPATDPRPGAPDARDVRPTTAIDLLTLHEDNYFLTGFTKETQVKFQFSFKYELWPNEGPHALQLAYTQRSVWALYDESSPFVETNYGPELFYTFYHRAGREGAPGCGFFLERAGLQHESNGQSPPLSRGWNRLYAETRFGCRD